jgi:hypothetical protein
MDWTNIIIAACASLGTIITIVSIIANQFDKVNKQFSEMNKQLAEIKIDIRQIDSRLSRIEGYIQGRDYNSTGTDHK